MPELPEVETIRTELSKKIVGKKITALDFDIAKGFVGQKKDVIDTEIVAIDRRAKLIRMKLSNNLSLLFHLKLTGQLIYQPPPKPLLEKEGRIEGSFAGGHPSHDWHAKLPNSNTRVTFTFSDGSKLFFNDMRKFGWCRVLTKTEIEKVFAEYGLEPFSKDFTTQYLLLKAKRVPNRPIKQFLMDQTIIAGIGNIYADETLFTAKILPTRKVKEVSLKEWQKIHDDIITVLQKALKYGGTTDSDYVRSDGSKGGMQDHLNVYHRTGQPCAGGCGGVVKRITLGGRGTHFCDCCQK